MHRQVTYTEMRRSSDVSATACAISISIGANQWIVPTYGEVVRETCGWEGRVAYRLQGVMRREFGHVGWSLFSQLS